MPMLCIACGSELCIDDRGLMCRQCRTEYTKEMYMVPKRVTEAFPLVSTFTEERWAKYKKPRVQFVLDTLDYFDDEEKMKVARQKLQAQMDSVTDEWIAELTESQRKAQKESAVERERKWRRDSPRAYTPSLSDFIN